MISNIELSPLSDTDRCAFGGASDTALINVDHDFAVLVDATGFLDEHKVEVVGVEHDGDPITYMIVLEDRNSAIRLATAILSLMDIVGYDPQPILRAMVQEGLGGSMIL